MKILLIGPQGSGKSTQAKLLAAGLNVPKVTVGDIYRKLAEGTDAEGRRIKEILDRGQLVDDATTAKMIKERLAQPDCQNGFVMDGYPRTLKQARLFDPRFDKVFYLKLKTETAIERLVKRGREDDTEVLIKRRLDLYRQLSQPLLDYYKNLGNLVEINAEGSIGKVADQISSYLK